MLIFGHRGAKGLAPENTLAGLEKAVDTGVDGIEFDVRTTKDGKIVAIHDPSLKRTAGTDMPVSGTSYEDLKSAYADLPDMKQMVDFLLPRKPFVLEVKRGSDPEIIIKALQEYGLADLPEDRFRIASFDFDILKTIKKELPGTTLVVNEPWSGVRASSRARRLGTKYITMNQKWLWSGFIRSVARSGYKLSTYTLNDAKKAKRWAKSGLYAAITDYPDRF